MPDQKQYYPDVNASPDFPEIEKSVLDFWRDEGLFRRSVDSRPPAHAGKNNEFIFYDGPPFANGLPHYGHLLTGYVKDLFARYQTMRGKRVERRFGWDCHGLPAEMGSEKELGISGRQAIMGYGIDRFNEHCRSSVMKYTHEWERYVSRQARWVDFANDYKTMDINFMESVLWAFKQLYDKGLVYEAYRVMPYSWAAETPLSNFETKLDNSYREREDKAITVAFELREIPSFIETAIQKIRNDDAIKLKKCLVFAWTTTPWTLPSNLALAVNSNIDYQVWFKGKDTAIIASENYILGNHNWFINEGYHFGGFFINQNESSADYTVFKGSKLVGLEYAPLFPYFADHPNAFRILDGSAFVTDTDGTGIVHMAPGFGEVDQQCCEANGIELVVPVDGQGKYTDAIYDIIPPLPLRERAGERGYSPSAQEHAKTLRQEMTEAETSLWQHLRAKRFDEYKFRRQQPVGPYIADFFCAAEKVIIELDGGQHAEQQDYDAKRTAFLENAGYRVLRFWNNDMQDNPEGVLETIQQALKEVPSPQPSPSRGEGVGLSLKGLNVIVDKNKTDADPFNEKQIEKFGLANLRIIRYLKNYPDGTNRIIREEEFKHNYPHCWRTDTPLIYRAMPSWYVEVTKFRDRAVELNKQINWIPEHVRDGQMGHMLATAPDWSISRNRFWGTPIPVWRSKSGKIIVIGSIEELEKRSGKKVTDLHRPVIDEIVIHEGGEEYRRVEDVFDCWFESGSMPFAQVHYPFENKEWFEHHFPADFITEYVGQTRGWFNTLIMLSTALFDKPPFLNCICHGVMLGESVKDPNTGKMVAQKLSKRLKNYPEPFKVFDEYGADALRWFLVSSSVMRGNDLQIDKEGKFIRDVVRLAIKPIWNAYNFFCLYANADGVKADLLYEINAGLDEWRMPQALMDRYILAKLGDATLAIQQALDGYDTPAACEAASQFFEALNNWYIRRSKPRFWKEEHDSDKQQAYDTLYTVLHVMSRAIAPLLPMVAEDMYLGLTACGQRQSGHSVHLADFPVLPGLRSLLGHDIVTGMDRARDICNAALAVRNARNLRVRLPLASLTVVSQGAAFAQDYADIIRDEVNVKQVNASNAFDDFATLKLQVNFPKIGARLGAKTKDIIPAVKSGKWMQLSTGAIEVAGVTLQPDEYTLLLEAKPEVKDSATALASNDALVLLDTNVTPELEAEGLARDLVRAVQQARKDAGLNVSDRIMLSLQGPQHVVAAALAHKAYIAEQTLSESLSERPLDEPVFKAEQVMDEQKVVIELALAA